MRSRLQLACCQLLFLSTIASSAQTPPTTTDVTMVEIQSMDESVEPRAINQYAVAEANRDPTLDAMSRAHQATEHEVWKHALEHTSFQLFYQATKEANQVHEARMEQDEDSLEDWMATYQLPTLEANHHHTITGTLDEVSKYPMEGSSDPNQSLEASVQDGTTMYQPPTAEANHHHTIDATFTVEDAFRYAMEDISDANQSVEASMEDGTTMFQHATTETTPPWAVDEVFNYGMEVGSFQTAGSNNVPLEYQDTVEANQAQTLPTPLDQEQATVDVDAPSMMTLNVLAMNTRNTSPASRMCHICNISESPVWHESDSVFLCDPCCSSLPKFKRVQALAEEKRAELMRLPDNHNHADGSKNGNGVLPSGAKCRKRKRIVLPASGKCQVCNTSESYAWHKGPDGVSNLCHSCGQKYNSKKNQALAEQNNAEIERLPDNHNHAEGSKNGDGVLPSGGKQRKGKERIVPPASGECYRCRKKNVKRWRRGPDDVANLCNSCGVFYWRKERNQSLQTCTSSGPISMASAAIQSCTFRASETTEAPSVRQTPAAIRSRRRRLLETPQERTARLAERRARESYKARSAPLAADATSIPGIPTLQTSKSRKPLSTHPMAVRSRELRASETSDARSARLTSQTLRARTRRSARRLAKVNTMSDVHTNQVEEQSPRLAAKRAKLV